MKRWLLALPVVAALAASGGYYYYSQIYVPSQAAAAEPQLQTATVRRGDLTLTASGVGNLVPAAEADLGFRTSGQLTELGVAVGDRVEAGQVLARLDDQTLQIQVAQAEFALAEAERSLAELTSAAAVANAELAVANARDSLDRAQRNLKYVQHPVSRSLEDAVRDAKLALDTTLANQQLANISQDVQDYNGNIWITDWYFQRAQDAQAKLDLNSGSLELQEAARKAWTDYQARADQQAARLLRIQTDQAAKANAALDAQDAYEAALANLTAAQQGPDAISLSIAQANVAVAEAALAEAQARLAEVRGEPVPGGAASTLADPRNKVEQARLALETAGLNLANAVLVAPFAGTVTAVNARVGETVGTGALITLAALDEPFIRFYIDEADLGSVAPGYAVSVVFDAAPSVTFSGSVTRVDPALVTVGNSSVVQAWARLDPNDSAVRLLAGMNAEVDVIAGQARNALLVPVQALRELAPGSYAVFVVQPGGKLRLTPVTVGLQDFASAEILSGLNLGDVVSTGAVETGS